VKTAVLDAHDGTALKGFFSRLEAVDHLVSMVGDSMAGGFLTTAPETMRRVLHSKFWTKLTGASVLRGLQACGQLGYRQGADGVRGAAPEGSPCLGHFLTSVGPCGSRGRSWRGVRRSGCVRSRGAARWS